MQFAITVDTFLKTDWGRMDTFNFFEEKPLAEITMGELQNMVRIMAEKRAEYEELKRIASSKNDEVEELEIKIMTILDAHNQDKFSVTGIGTVYTTDKFQVSFPKDPDQADKLRSYCRENGLDSMLTINHQSLQGLFKSKKEERELQGITELQDVLPGVGEPKLYRTIGLRKG